jgi:hypothetical protein
MTILPVDPNVMALVFELLLLKIPVVRVKLFSARVPLVSVVVLVAPTVNASCKVQVPPTPSKVTGKSNVLPRVVIDWLLVEANVRVFVPAVKVVPAVNVNVPAINNKVFANVTVDPVKFKFLTNPVTDIVSEPAVTFTDKALTADPPLATLAIVTVLVTALALPLNVILDVPVKVKLVIVPIDTTVAVEVDVTVILPVVSNAIDLTFELILEKMLHVSVKLFNARVPLVRVAVRVEPKVNASCNVNVPPTPSKVTGKSNVLLRLVTD